MRPTVRQQAVYERLAAKFSRTPPWRSILRDETFSRLSPEEAYCILGRLFDELQSWTFRRLPRSAGLPATDEGWKDLRAKAREEERHARLVVPDEQAGPIDDRKDPDAVPYWELNPDLKEDLELDYPGLFRHAARL